MIKLSSWDWESIKALVEQTHTNLHHIDDPVRLRAIDVQLKAIRLWCDVDKEQRATAQVKQLEDIVAELKRDRLEKAGVVIYGSHTDTTAP